MLKSSSVMKANDLKREINSALSRHESAAKLRKRIKRLLAKWEPRLGIHVQKWQIKDAKKYWATMDETRNEIWFGADLAGMPPKFVEIIVVHELIHYLTQGHDHDFFRLMNRHLPGWRRIYERLGRRDEIPALYGK